LNIYARIESESRRGVEMTKGFPAKCVEHPEITIWNTEQIVKHREQYNCYADIVSIHSKKWAKLQKRRSG